MDKQARRESGEARLEQAYQELEAHTPDAVSRFLAWIRKPQGRKVRLPLGLLLVLAGLVGPIVPVLGVEFIPVGLLLIAQDVPPLRRPVADATLWLEHQWLDWRRRRQGHT